MTPAEKEGAALMIVLDRMADALELIGSEGGPPVVPAGATCQDCAFFAQDNRDLEGRGICYANPPAAQILFNQSQAMIRPMVKLKDPACRFFQQK